MHIFCMWLTPFIALASSGPSNTLKALMPCLITTIGTQVVLSTTGPEPFIKGTKGTKGTAGLKI